MKCTSCGTEFEESELSLPMCDICHSKLLTEVQNLINELKTKEVIES